MATTPADLTRVEVVPRRYGRGFGPARPCPSCGRAVCRYPTTGLITRHNLPVVPPDGMIWVRWHGRVVPSGITAEPGYPSIPKPGERCPASGTIDPNHEIRKDA